MRFWRAPPEPANSALWSTAQAHSTPGRRPQAGVDLMHLLWVRANGRLEAALKAADLILHSGGFGVIVLDLCEASAAELNRIPLSYWYRFRGAVENTPGNLLWRAMCRWRNPARACPWNAREGALWIGSTPLFNGIEFASIPKIASIGWNRHSSLQRRLKRLRLAALAG